MIQTFSFFSLEECQKILRTVDELKNHWAPLGTDPAHPYFYTLGAASYSYARNPEAYEEVVRVVNPVMREHLGWLYEKILKKLSAELGGEFRLGENVGIPGFHIYPRVMPNGGKIHRDRQYKLAPWTEPEKLDFSKIGSLTVVIELPKSGGGLRYWPEADAENHGQMEVVNYQTGFGYFFAGDLLHQIAPNPEVLSGERRVTMQVHLIWHHDGHWIVYW